MPRIILCRGIQGSGKSTWAKQWVLEDPEHRVRFNNDDIRNMLGKYWVPSRERIVTEIKKDFMINAMELGYDIVIDNMNLNSNEVTYYKDLAASTSRLISPYVVEFKDFFIPLEVCIERDSKRENPIGEEIIRATYERYKHIIG
ncbi:polynucleotide kinase [uncultured phage cr18_1]|uniref:Polynucleotide kinase n=1 Tax=uncultured phage cr18_1 TaxID=2986407 RepID=A0AAE7V4E4_9CAUD|nr:polynucleotide kinase [uncultured phage cr18_1]QWM90102.1 polynucleotide kinase [uncultured phage cr18_1]